MTLHTLGLLALDLLRLVAGPWAELPEGYGDTLDPEELAGEVAPGRCDICRCCPLALRLCGWCEGEGGLPDWDGLWAACGGCDGKGEIKRCEGGCSPERRHP
jgi:hypothetical protein